MVNISTGIILTLIIIRISSFAFQFVISKHRSLSDLSILLELSECGWVIGLIKKFTPIFIDEKVVRWQVLLFIISILFDRNIF